MCLGLVPVSFLYHCGTHEPESYVTVPNFCPWCTERVMSALSVSNRSSRPFPGDVLSGDRSVARAAARGAAGRGVIRRYGI